MEHPAKRLKISRPDSRSPRDAGSRMKEGLFTSELGTTSDEADGMWLQQPTRTISLRDMQRARNLDTPRQMPRFVRRDAGVRLLPRVPDATVTASVVDVNVDVGSTTLDATVVAAATSDVLVSVSTLGTVTIPAADLTTETTMTITTTDASGSQTTITTTSEITLLPSDTTSSSATLTDPLASILPGLSSIVAGNNTITSTESTVTVTATSTLELSYTNGTFVVASSTLSRSSGLHTSTGHSKSLVTNTHSSGQSSTAVFGSTGPAETGASPGGSAASGSDGPQGGAAATAASTGAAASATTSSTSHESPGPGLTPSQQQVVGGVVGGVAGVAVVLLVALIFLRWYRRRLKSQGRLPEQQPGASRGITTSGGESFSPMSERSSNVPLAAAMASFGRRLRTQSSHTFATTATSATSTTIPESERGFQRIAGRKIAPVLSGGVDQYGGNYGAFEKDMGDPMPLRSPQPTERELAGTSFYRDSGGFYGGSGGKARFSSTTPSPAPTTPSAPTHSRNISHTRDFAADSPTITASKPEGFAVLRPSPARTPSTSSPSNSSIRLPIQQATVLDEEAPPTPALPQYLVVEQQQQRDAIGRSLASQDGSRVSKGSGSRFSERL